MPLGLPKLSVEPVLALPLWLGTLRDRSGYENHLSLVNTPHWSSAGGQDGACTNSTNYFSAAHSDSQAVESLSFFFWGKRFQQNTGSVFIRKTGVGTRYQFYAVNAATLNLYNGAVSSTIALSVEGRRSVAVTLDNGNKPRFFMDGVFRGLGSTVQTISPTTSPLTLMAFAGVFAGAAVYPGALSDPEIALLHAYSQPLITPRKQWPGGGLRYPGRGDPYVPATGDPMYIDNIQSARVTLADQTSGQLSNTGLQIITGTWALTESAAGRAITCVGAGKLRRRLIGADGFTTHRFVGTGAAALTKNATNIEIDAGNGDTITAVHLTAP